MEGGACAEKMVGFAGGATAVFSAAHSADTVGRRGAWALYACLRDARSMQETEEGLSFRF